MIGTCSAWRLLSQTEGAKIDQTVRDGLARSLNVCFERARDSLTCDRNRFLTFLNEIRDGPVRPAVFGVYTDIVEILTAGDDARLDLLFHSLLDVKPRRTMTRIVSLSDDDLGTGQAERYARLLNDDAERRYELLPLEDTFAEAKNRVSSALELLGKAVPELAQEISGLVREIVLVTDGSSDKPASPNFDGASTFYLWGAVFLNAGRATRLDLVQAIAHEAAHLMLFGLMMGQPLTENDSAERYSSPLRQDSRPMEGVVHAANVLVRMSYALERMLETGLLSPEEQETARADLDIHRHRFFDTLPVISEYARLKPKADEIFSGATEYMRELGPHDPCP